MHWFIKDMSMTVAFQPNGLSTWIGSLPLHDHQAAVRLMLAHSPDIPLWIQLPCFANEGMITQFLPGLPGLVEKDGKCFIQTGNERFEAELLGFFEDYMEVAESGRDLDNTRFALTPAHAPGFFALLNALKVHSPTLSAVKGQITGPFTFATSITDQHGRAIFYDSQLRDVAVKLIAMKACWQARRLKAFGAPVMIFFDEPGLAGFGGSAFISVSRRDVADCFDEVMQAAHQEGALAGVHVCANTEWPLILESSADIVSFDAYSFFDKFILYPKEIKAFLDAGKIIAWGIAPTGDIERIEKETPESLVALWESEVARMAGLGFDRSSILSQSLITPSCGVGALPLSAAERAIWLTREVSDRIRKMD